MYLALGKAKQALPDLQQVLKMKPDFLAVSFVPSFFFCSDSEFCVTALFQKGGSNSDWVHDASFLIFERAMLQIGLYFAIFRISIEMPAQIVRLGIITNII